MPAETDPTYQVNRKVLQSLHDSYWSSGGWRDDVPPPSESAIAAGIMFAEKQVAGHDEVVETARANVAKLSLPEVGDAFLASLTSRRLDLRSALGSYAVARHLPRHAFRSGPEPHLCETCGLADEPARIDRNVLSFERFKWGGVRRDDLTYVAFDLEQFLRAPRLEPTSADIDLARTVFETLRDLTPDTTATRAAAALRALPGNKDERSVVLDILGVCGILESEGHPGYADRFIPHVSRTLPPAHFVELAYPVCWWRAADGVSATHLSTFLPRAA